HARPTTGSSGKIRYSTTVILGRTERRVGRGFREEADMTGRRMGAVVGSAVAVLLMGIGLSGCDYWPPALQAQIEQLQAEAQAAAAERVKLLGQLNEAN